MIKKYNQFVNERINEDVDDFEDDFDTNQQESELANDDLEDELDEFESEEDFEDDEEEEMEEEGGDIYVVKLKEVADKLGVDVVNGRVEYNGKKIIFPSETEMYHVDNKKFKTSDEVVSYLENSGKLTDEELDEKPEEITNIEGDREADEMDEDERYAAMEESKSYKTTRNFKK